MAGAIYAAHKKNLKESSTVSTGMTDSEGCMSNLVSPFGATWAHVASNPNAKYPQVCWLATLSHNGGVVGEFSYSQGVGYIPGYAPHARTVQEREYNTERVRLACTKGLLYRLSFGRYRRLPTPSLTGLLYALASDAMCWYGARDVEEFASEFGYTDQGYAGARAADKAYAACGKAAQTLGFCGLGLEKVRELMEACDA